MLSLGESAGISLACINRRNMPSESHDEEHESMRIQQLEDDLKVLKKEHEEILAGEEMKCFPKRTGLNCV